jgi:hypothetical protein
MVALNSYILSVAKNRFVVETFLRYGPWLLFALTVWLKNVFFHSTVQIWPEGRVVVFPPLGALASV